MLSPVPAPLALPDLLALTRGVAGEGASGRHTVHVDPDHHGYHSPSLSSLSHHPVDDRRLRRTHSEPVEQGSPVGVG